LLGEVFNMATKTTRCPSCNSKDISAWTGAGAGTTIYSCKYCGYKGPKAVEEFQR